MDYLQRYNKYSNIFITPFTVKNVGGTFLALSFFRVLVLFVSLEIAGSNQSIMFTIIFDDILP